MSGKQYLSIDVGGTAIKFGILSEEGKLLQRDEIPTAAKTLDEYLDVLASLYEPHRGKVEAIAMSAPGKVDAQTGYFYTGGAMRFMDGVNLKKLMQERTGARFSVENDARCAALAELWKGSMRGIDNGAVMTLGTGVGGAIIIGGDLYRGSNFSAGELSVVPLHWEEPYDRHACLYNMLGVGRLSARYAERVDEDPAQMNGRVLFGRVNEGRPKALEVLKEYCDALATTIYGLQTTLDLRRYAIGGGISRQAVLFETLERSLDETFERAKGFPAACPEVVPCTFASDANMIGALYHNLRTAE